MPVSVGWFSLERSPRLNSFPFLLLFITCGWYWFEVFTVTCCSVAGITSFRCDHFGATISARPFLHNHFGATYFVAVRFLHKSFRRQFGALWQFTYLGLGLGVSVSKKHRLLVPKRAAPKSRGPSGGGAIPPPPIGMSTKMQNGKNTTFSALLRLFCALEWAE